MAATSALSAAIEVRNNQEKSYVGGLGVSAGLLTYAAFLNPGYFRFIKLSPITILAASLLYGFYNEDRSVLGGVSAGYAAFLLAL